MELQGQNYRQSGTTWDDNFKDAYRRSKEVYNRKRRFKVPEYTKQFIIKFPPELSYLILYDTGICIVLNYNGHRLDIEHDYEDPDWFFILHSDGTTLRAYDSNVSDFDYSKVKEIVGF